MSTSEIMFIDPMVIPNYGCASIREIGRCQGSNDIDVEKYCFQCTNYDPNNSIVKGGNMSEDKPYTITDRRGMKEGQEHSDEVCRVCGSKEVHSKQYGKPTTECITFLKNQIVLLERMKPKQINPDYHG